jgi:3-dehydroquinate synthase class II
MLREANNFLSVFIALARDWKIVPMSPLIVQFTR